MASDDDIRSYLGAFGSDPNKVVAGMKANNIGFEDIYRALSNNPGGNKNLGDISNYVANSGNDWLKDQYKTWTGGTGAGFGSTDTGIGLNNANKSVALAQNAATLPAVDGANANNPAVNAPASISDSVKGILSGLSIFAPKTQAMPDAPAKFTPTQAQLDGIDSTKRISSLLADGSPVLQQALDKANMASNGRGLLNTSMGVQSGTQALISQAADIANNDANRFGQLTGQGIQQDTTLGNTALQGQVQSSLTSQQNANTWNNKLADAGIQAAADNTKYAQGLQTKAIDTQTARENLDKSNNIALQQAYAGDISTISNNLATQINTLQQSDLPADVKQGQINSAIAVAKGLVAFKNSIYTNMPQWKAEWQTLSLVIPK